MLIKIAWKNIWRNRLRSLVVIMAIALGLWAGTSISGFSWGMYDQRINEAINNEISHVQFHQPGFGEEYNPALYIPESAELIQRLKKDERVKAVSPRVIVMSMIASARANGGVRVLGVNPESEIEVTDLSSKVVEGAFLEGVRRNPIVVGEKLAEKLRLRLRSKLVLTFQTTDGQLVSASFRVAGIYKSINTKYDELNVFVRDTDLQSLLGKEGVVHEIAVLLNDNRQTVAFSKDYAGAYPKLLVQWWGEIMPELQLAIETFDQIMGIIIFIILLALAFGIINTMLMAVLERVKELGMLMAVGMNRKRVFLMIMYETIMLMVVGAPLGLLMGYFTITGLGQVGIDLSHWGEGLSSYGFNAIIYPKLEGDKYLKILVQVVVVTLVSALIPARRALKLNPVDAIRTA